MALRALFWDVDGTIAETEEVHRQAFNAAFAGAGLGIRWDEEEYARLLRVSGGRERIEAYLERERPPLPSGETAHCLAARLHRVKNACYRGLVAAGRAEVRPGVLRLMREAAETGLIQAICTTSGRGNVLALLHASRIDPELFSLIATAEDAPRKKPAPDVYLFALTRLGLDPGDCLVIEDSRNGLMAATAAGIPTIVTPGRYSSGEDFAGALAVAGHLGEPDDPATVAFPPRRKRRGVVGVDALRQWSDEAASRGSPGQELLRG